MAKDDERHDQSAGDKNATASSHDAYSAPSEQPSKMVAPAGLLPRGALRDGGGNGVKPDGSDGQGCGEAPYLGALPNGALRVKGAPSITVLAPHNEGAKWYPLVHDIAHRILVKLCELEQLMKAKRHPTGIAPWDNGGVSTRAESPKCGGSAATRCPTRPPIKSRTQNG